MATHVATAAAILTSCSSSFFFAFRFPVLVASLFFFSMSSLSHLTRCAASKHSGLCVRGSRKSGIQKPEGWLGCACLDVCVGPGLAGVQVHMQGMQAGPCQPVCSVMLSAPE